MIHQQTGKMISEAYIREELKQVKDPEIPTISIVDLGIVTGIDINDKNVHTAGPGARPRSNTRPF